MLSSKYEQEGSVKILLQDVQSYLLEYILVRIKEDTGAQIRSRACTHFTIFKGDLFRRELQIASK